MSAAQRVGVRGSVIVRAQHRSFSMHDQQCASAWACVRARGGVCAQLTSFSDEDDLTRCVGTKVSDGVPDSDRDGILHARAVTECHCLQCLLELSVVEV
jgi:hypothetical protein